MLLNYIAKDEWVNCCCMILIVCSLFFSNVLAVFFKFSRLFIFLKVLGLFGFQALVVFDRRDKVD